MLPRVAMERLRLWAPQSPHGPVESHGWGAGWGDEGGLTQAEAELSGSEEARASLV